MEKIYEGKTKTVFKLENGNVLLKNCVILSEN